MAKKATISTIVVSWAGDKPLKYQSSLEYQVSNNRTIRILGDPMSTKEKAEASLRAEFNKWNEAMTAFYRFYNNR